jgi:SpoVK/Ycf46/Vps4 family AAA+-type ATPase
MQATNDILLKTQREAFAKTRKHIEMIKRPLYKVHTGTLGTDSVAIEKALTLIFARAKQWRTVLLLDEADVFVARRGQSLEQNAIVAEFLRTMEYFDGLMFMTTNRPEDIDDAIVPRCAAIIDYNVPDPAGARVIWKIQANLNNVTLDDALLDDLIDLFPGIAPRDIKMLLALTIRFAKSKGLALEADVFRRCAMFRAIKMKHEG